MKKIICLVSILIIFASCATPPVYDDDWPVERYFRKAQEHSDRGRYKLALGYYDQVYARFPSRLDKIATAEYEQGFIYFKMKNYEAAKELFETVLIRFSDPLTANFFGPSDEWVRYSADKLLQKSNASIKNIEAIKAEKAKKKAEKEAKKLSKKAARAEADSSDDADDISPPPPINEVTDDADPWSLDVVE